MRSFEEHLDVLARLALDVGVGFAAGDRLRLTGPIEAAPLIRRITTLAYDTGATFVDVHYVDDRLALARAMHARDETLDVYPQEHADVAVAVAERGDAVIRVSGRDPDLMSAADPARVARMMRSASAATRRVGELASRLHMPWTAVPYVVPAWASKVFPHLSEGEAVERLWGAVFAATRVDADDPAAAWSAHVGALAARRQRLDALALDALHVRGPGTDLRIGLAHEHVWVGGGAHAEIDGRRFVPNIPTEEVFTAPHARRVEGVVRATKPLSYQGQVIEDFSLTFEGGEVVDVAAERGQAVLERLLATDAGARRLGEVALVPHSSPISQSGLLFYDTLFDENASCHIALGRAYPISVKGGRTRPQGELERDGLNHSLTHVDFMIGSSEVDVDGLLADGRIEPLLRGGEWVEG